MCTQAPAAGLRRSGSRGASPRIGGALRRAARSSLLSALCAATCLSALSAEPCRHTTLRPPPGRRIAGAWIVGGQLLLQEVGDGRLLRYGRSDGELDDRAEDEGPLLDMIPYDGGRLALEATAVLTARDREGRVYARQELPAEGASGLTILGLREMAAAPGGLLAVGFLRLPDGSRREGVVRARSLPLEPLDTAWTFPAGWKGEIFYRLGGRDHLATAGDRTYFLRLGEPPAIVDLSATPPSALRAMPEGFARLPLLPPARGRDAVVPLFAALEHSDHLVGLYGVRDALFLLTVRSAAAGNAWRLFRIDPRGDRISGRWDLPVEGAAHLTAIPGTPEWAFLVRGPVTAPAEQRLSTVLWIRADRFFDTSRGPLCADAP